MLLKYQYHCDHKGLNALLYYFYLLCFSFQVLTIVNLLLSIGAIIFLRAKGHLTLPFLRHGHISSLTVELHSNTHTKNDLFVLQFTCMKCAMNTSHNTRTDHSYPIQPRDCIPNLTLCITKHEKQSEQRDFS